MPRSLRLPAVLALLAVGATGAAAQPAAAQEITLAEAVQTAVARSPELRRAVVADRASALNVDAARAGRLPSVAAQVSPSQQYGLTFDQTTGSLASQTVESMNLGVGLDLRLLDGGRTRHAVAQAQFQRDAAQAGAERTQQQVALDVAQRFLQLLLDRELVEIQAGQLRAAELQREQVLGLVEGGARPRGELVAQDAVVAERRSALVEAQGAVARDEAQLVQAIGLDPLGTYRFTGPSLVALEAAGALTRRPASLAELLAAARAGRPDVRAQALRIDAAEAAIGIARSGARPTLDLGASVGTGYSSLQQRLADPDAVMPTVPVTLADGTPVVVGGQPFTLPAGNPDLERTPLFSQFTDNRSGRIGVTLSVPLFDRYQTRRATAEARIQADDQRLQLETLERQVAAEVQQASVEVDIAAARLAAADAQVEAAEAALRVEQDRYALGAGTLYLVADAQSRLTQAASSRAQAAYGLVFRIALVRLAVGDVDAAALAAELLGR
jgi:outer membrane protein